MMLYIILVTITTISLVVSQPIDTLKTEPSDPTDEVVYVPYAVKYVPIEVPIKSEKTSKIEDGLPNEDIKLLPIKTNSEEISQPQNEFLKDLQKQSNEHKESSFNLFKDKFPADSSKSSEDYVLVPISVLKRLQEGSNADSSSKVITKRQAPGLGPRRRLSRRPAFVGYFNDYDLFPTVA